MAKKRRRTPKTGKAHIQARAPVWDGQTMAHASSLPKTRRSVVKAHEKHKNDLLVSSPSSQSSSTPTLADRFHALPDELRAEILSFLLERPVKWDINHRQECPLRFYSGDITPEKCDDLCATDWCGASTWAALSNKGSNLWTYPWRSQWAPEQRNLYVCSSCYDERLRTRPFPEAKSLPCLCARRANLQVMLVCCKWYQEAGKVFYTRNTFAFEDSTTFVNFAANLPPIWRNTISKVSLVLPSIEATDSTLEQHRASKKQIWSVLRTFSSLSSLELDFDFLTDAHNVHSMIRMGLRSLRQCSFVVETQKSSSQGSEHVWPSWAHRTLVRGGFAEEVARAIKGQRQKALKTKGYIQQNSEALGGGPLGETS